MRSLHSFAYAPSEFKSSEGREDMPCLYISTNLNLDEVDTDPLFSQATKAVASIIGRPEHVISSFSSFTHHLYVVMILSTFTLFLAFHLFGHGWKASMFSSLITMNAIIFHSFLVSLNHLTFFSLYKRIKLGDKNIGRFSSGKEPAAEYQRSKVNEKRKKKKKGV